MVSWERLSRSDRGSPSSHSMARYGVPPGVLPPPMYRTMPGWRRVASTSASRAKRSILERPDGVEHLQRDRLPRLEVPSAVDLPHPACAR